MEIIPFVGFADIKFGMSEDEVVSILGPAAQRETEQFDDGSNDITLRYAKPGVDLTFYSEDDFRLGTITFFTPNYKVLGNAIIGEDEAVFVGNASNRGFDDLTLEDDFEDLDSKDYFSEKYGISFWVCEGKVDSITIFPEYGDDDEVIWPK